jgi:hypothetical protein
MPTSWIASYPIAPRLSRRSYSAVMFQTAQDAMTPVLSFDIGEKGGLSPNS